ncbi:MAG: hypothetical protein IT448_12060 [Phycisphaerales bacterium]|nr:hypothetical protein [Phycisphaerales bacterium]
MPTGVRKIENPGSRPSSYNIGQLMLPAVENAREEGCFAQLHREKRDDRLLARQWKRVIAQARNKKTHDHWPWVELNIK